MTALLTSKETAERLRLTEWQLWALRRQGVLRAVKIGRAVRFDERDLQAFIDAHREGGEAA